MYEWTHPYINWIQLHLYLSSVYDCIRKRERTLKLIWQTYRQTVQTSTQFRFQKTLKTLLQAHCRLFLPLTVSFWNYRYFFYLLQERYKVWCLSTILLKFFNLILITNLFTNNLPKIKMIKYLFTCTTLYSIQQLHNANSSCK